LADRLAPGVRQLARQVGELAAERGVEAFLVGGPVRDLLLGERNVDLDLMVTGDAIGLARAAARQLGGTVKTHGRFGTAALTLPDGRKVDLATARSERYARPGALPEVQPGSLQEDLQRRDYAINAMALSLRPDRFGVLADPFGGERDLQTRRLRILHDDSFADDPTRLLRGVRFETRLGFRMEPRTEARARAAAGGAFDTLTPERLRREFFRLFDESKPEGSLLRLAELGFWDWFAPGLALEREQLERLSPALRWWQAAGGETLRRPLVFLAALLAPLGVGEAARIAGARLRLAPEEARVLRAAMAAPQSLPPAWSERRPAPGESVRALRRWTPEALVSAYARCASTAMQAVLDRYVREWRHVRPAITGDDLLARGWRAGPLIGAALEAVLAAKLAGVASGREAELEYAQAWLARESGRE
jgi:tRNA nucleotidyltransferase (CCA-adding enzyme)